MASRYIDPLGVDVSGVDGSIDEDNPAFGAKLRLLRQRARLSQTELARRVHYSKTQVSRLESGKLRPSLPMAEACERALGAEGALIGLVPPPARRRPPWSASPTVDLPGSTKVFVGRTRQIDEILSVVRPVVPRPGTGSEALGRYPSRVVVVWGLPGVGKTELVVQVAECLLEQHPDGCLYLDLRGGGDRVDAFDAMGRLLGRVGIAAEIIPIDPAERCALYRRVLRGRRLLLVLDNPATAADVAALSVPGGESTTLVASRRRLDALDEARHLRLDPLDPADASVLVETLVGGRFDRLQDQDRSALDVVLAACGYLPLALRVVAARLRGAAGPSLKDLAAELSQGDHLSVLDDGERSITRTFLAACAALPADESRLLACLAVHPGVSVDVRAASVLSTDTAAAARRTLDGLVTAGLAFPVAPRRYALHDLVREVARLHALATLSDVDIRDTTEHLIYGYLAMAQRADVTITPDRHRPAEVSPSDFRWPASFADTVEARAWLDAEQDNLVAVCELAAAEGLHDVCWRLAYAMRDHFFRTKAVHPWIRTHEIALSSARAVGNDWAVAVTLNNLGLAHTHAGRHDLAGHQYTQALESFRQMDDRVGIAGTLGHRAWLAYAVGDNATAAAEAFEALALYRAAGARRHIGITLRTLGLAEVALGQVTQATGHFRDALEIFVELHLVFDESMALNCLGEAARATGDPSAARGFHIQAWLRARAYDSAAEQARALRGLAAVAEAIGRPASAARLTAHAADLVGHPSDTP